MITIFTEFTDNDFSLVSGYLTETEMTRIYVGGLLQAVTSGDSEIKPGTRFIQTSNDTLPETEPVCVSDPKAILKTLLEYDRQHNLTVYEDMACIEALRKQRIVFVTDVVEQAVQLDAVVPYPVLTVSHLFGGYAVGVNASYPMTEYCLVDDLALPFFSMEAFGDKPSKVSCITNPALRHDFYMDVIWQLCSTAKLYSKGVVPAADLPTDILNLTQQMIMYISPNLLDCIGIDAVEKTIKEIDALFAEEYPDIP